MADQVTSCPVQPLVLPPADEPIVSPKTLSVLPRFTPFVPMVVDFAVPKSFEPPRYLLPVPSPVLSGLKTPIVSGDSVAYRPQIFYKSPIRFNLSGAPTSSPGDPLINPQLVPLQQAAPKFLEIGPMQFGKFGGDVDGFAIGPVFGGIFAPSGVKLSLGLFANIPSLGSGVAAYRFNK